MAQNEVAAVADACGHGGDDAACECWGVWGESYDRDRWMALSCVDGNERTNYVAAYGEAVLYRQGALKTTMSFRVKRYPASNEKMCVDCNAWPCDCSKPIWIWRYRSSEYPAGRWRGGHDKPRGERRSVLVSLHADEAPYGVERGPIQRITDPPFEFPTRPSRKPLHGDCTFCGTRGEPDDICCDELRKYRMGHVGGVGCRHAASDPKCECWIVWQRGVGGCAVGGRRCFEAAYTIASRSNGAYVVRERHVDTGDADHPMVDAYLLKYIDPPNATSASSDSSASRMHEPVAECGHKLDSSACRCWGVRVTQCKDVNWVGLADGGDRCNWSRADQLRTTMRGRYPDVPYLVTRHDVAASPPAIPAKRPVTTRKCSLAWCNAQTTATFCSDRCIDYGHRVYTLTERRDAFLAQAKARSMYVMYVPAQTYAELAWAQDQTAADIAALERSWHAVQHESAVGDERFFKLLDDEDV